jgi:pimeloyl-ACP methyl ester carboxylesterase
VFVHGGGWKRFSKDYHANVGRAFARKGLTTAVLSYRTSMIEWSTLLTLDLFWSLVLCWFGLLAPSPSPDLPPGAIVAILGCSIFVFLVLVQVYLRSRQDAIARWPDHRDDVADAIQFLVKGSASEHINPHNVFVVGHSAGGHITLMTTLSSDVLRSRHILVQDASSEASLKLVAEADRELRSHFPSDAMEPLSLRGDKTVADAEDVDARVHDWMATVRGVVAISPPCAASDMSHLVGRRLYLRPAFGPDPDKWEESFPTAVVRREHAAGTLPRPPLMLATADPGYDLGLDVQVDNFQRVLAACGYGWRRLRVVGSNHFSEIMALDSVSSSPAETILMPAIVEFVKEFGQTVA